MFQRSLVQYSTQEYQTKMFGEELSEEIHNGHIPEAEMVQKALRLFKEKHGIDRNL